MGPTGDENEIQRQIEQRINALPQNVQNAILSSEFGDKVLAIGGMAKLHLDQIQSLNDSTMFFMLGFIDESEYQKEIANLAGTPDITQKVFSNINAQILLPIRESMKKFAAGASAPQATAPAASIPTTPTSPAARASLSSVLPLSSASAAPQAAISTPVSAPIPATPTASIATPAVPKLEMHPADLMLTEKTVVTAPASPVPPPATAAPSISKPAEAKVEPPKPADYKADPYREPIS